MAKKKPEWIAQVLPYKEPSVKRALWQLVNTFIPYFALWGAMIYSVKAGYPYWVTLGLSLVAAGLLVRIFILFHDCCHGSFFASRTANAWLGTLAGIVTFTPYKGWRRDHNIHHATVGNLDRRGFGDVLTLTVAEYLAASPIKRCLYRLYRNPLVMFGLGPLWVFLLKFRFYSKATKPPERISILVTNLGLAILICAASWTIGLKAYLAIQLPVILIGGALGVWLFYVQHQYEKSYWAHQTEWDEMEASLKGSSYLKLPKVLQWFSGNIGLHHIHHICSGIPNYNLQRCFDGVAALRAIEPMTFRTSLHTIGVRLWDEEGQRMVGFGAVQK